MMVSSNPSLNKRIRRFALSLVDERTASLFKPLSRDSNTFQGINVHGAIIDELHVHADRDLIDNLETATSARSQPMTIKITTARHSRCHRLGRGASRLPSRSSRGRADG